MLSRVSQGTILFACVSRSSILVWRRLDFLCNLSKAMSIFVLQNVLIQGLKHFSLSLSLAQSLSLWCEGVKLVTSQTISTLTARVGDSHPHLYLLICTGSHNNTTYIFYSTIPSWECSMCLFTYMRILYINHLHLLTYHIQAIHT